MFQYLCIIKKIQSISLKCEMIELLAILNILHVYNQCFCLSPCGLIAVHSEGYVQACMWFCLQMCPRGFRRSSVSSVSVLPCVQECVLVDVCVVTEESGRFITVWALNNGCVLTIYLFVSSSDVQLSVQPQRDTRMPAQLSEGHPCSVTS